MSCNALLGDTDDQWQWEIFSRRYMTYGLKLIMTLRFRTCSWPFTNSSTVRSLVYWLVIKRCMVASSRLDCGSSCDILWRSLTRCNELKERARKFVSVVFELDIGSFGKVRKISLSLRYDRIEPPSKTVTHQRWKTPSMLPRKARWSKGCSVAIVCFGISMSLQYMTNHLTLLIGSSYAPDSPCCPTR